MMLEKLVDKLGDRVTDLMAVQKEQQSKIDSLIQVVSTIQGDNSGDPWEAMPDGKPVDPNDKTTILEGDDIETMQGTN